MKNVFSILLLVAIVAAMAIACTSCGKEEHVHTPGEAVVENEIPGSCLKTGSYESVSYCTDCGEEIRREVIPTKKTGCVSGETKRTKLTDLTCTQDETYQETVSCTVCKTVLSDKTVVTKKAEGHKKTTVQEVVEVTCTQYGHTDSVDYCTVCGDELNRTELSRDAEAPGHIPMNAVIKEYVPNSCQEDGYYIEAVYCQTCEQEIVELEKIIIPQRECTKGDEVKENEVAATCLNPSSYDSVFYCEECGEELSRENIINDDQVKHADTYEYKVVISDEIPYTCTKDGSYVKTTYCTECGDGNLLISTEKVSVPAQHTPAEPVKVGEILPTDTQDGSYLLITYCKYCNHVIHQETVVVPRNNNEGSDD